MVYNYNLLLYTFLTQCKRVKNYLPTPQMTIRSEGYLIIDEKYLHNHKYIIIYNKGFLKCLNTFLLHEILYLKKFLKYF